MFLLDSADRILIAIRHAERADPVVPRSHGDNSQQHLTGIDRLLNKKTVHDLVQRTVAPYGDNAAESLLHGRHGQFRRMELMFGEDRFGLDSGIPQELGDQGKMVKPAATSGHGIDNDEPTPTTAGQGHLLKNDLF